jgi:hypothetical protein
MQLCIFALLLLFENEYFASFFWQVTLVSAQFFAIAGLTICFAVINKK